jgi:peptide/nickel transport system permease protein
MRSDAVLSQNRPGHRSRSVLSAVLRFMKKKPLGAIGALLLLTMIVVAIFAPLVATHNRFAHDVDHLFEAPSLRHLAGTDNFGRDVWSRLVFGARISIYVGLVAVISASVVGMAVGMTSGFVGGKVDLVVQRIVDVVMGFPGLIFAMVLVAALGASLNNVVLAIAVSMSPNISRVARSSVLGVQESDFILAAKSLGASNFRILTRHVVPNSLAPLIVLSTGLLGSAIITEAGLSFLGLGIPPPHPSWGRMLQEGARLYAESAPWLVLFPGIALTVAVFGFSLFGDALRDILDPKLRGR